MGKLLDRIEKEPPNLGGRLRGIPFVLSRMTFEDQKDLMTALRNPEIQTSIISRILVDEGYQISRSAVDRYRRSL